MVVSHSRRHNSKKSHGITILLSIPCIVVLLSRTIATAAFQNPPRKTTTALSTDVTHRLLLEKSHASYPSLQNDSKRRTGTTPLFHIPMPIHKTVLKATTNDNNEQQQQPTTTKGRARFSSPTSTSTTIDSILSTISSDISGITLGLIGLTIAFINRLTSIDFDATDVTATAEIMGRQSRSDLLAVFAAGAVLLNGISKLDVTSALAETVVLEGENLGGDGAIFRNEGWVEGRRRGGDGLKWALESVLRATPARSAVLLLRGEEEEEENDDSTSTSLWKPYALAGVVPNDKNLRWDIPTSTLRATPILDKFLSGTAKESYLPTLQALPGKVEFTYLPPNAQEALLLPVYYTDGDGDGGGGGSEDKIAVLVLGSDTAKSFTPRDVAWCQVVASRIATFL